MTLQSSAYMHLAFPVVVMVLEIRRGYTEIQSYHRGFRGAGGTVLSKKTKAKSYRLDGHKVRHRSTVAIVPLGWLKVTI